jgi:hypothetical protein
MVAPHTVVTHAIHQIPQAGPALSRKRVTRVSQVVEVQGRQTDSRDGFRPPCGTPEVTSSEDFHQCHPRRSAKWIGVCQLVPVGWQRQFDDRDGLSGGVSCASRRRTVL